MAPVARILRAMLLGACASLITVSAVGAQTGITLPLDDVAYVYIDALQARGLLRDLPVLERPYSVGAVRSATRTVRSEGRDGGVRRWLDAIDAAAEKYAPSVGPTDSSVFVAGVAANVVAQTSGTRDLMQSDRVNTLAPGFAVRGLLVSGPITGAVRVLADRRMRVDPEFLGRRDRVLSARTEDGYIGITHRFASVQAGRIGRSWGLPGQLGLMVSNGAYTYDHLHLRLGGDKLHLSTVVARLDDERLNFSTDTMAQRYFTAHRLGMRLGAFEAGISESVVYGGVARGFQPLLANPVSPLFLTQYSDGDPINVAFGADILWRSATGLMLGGQTFIDDFQIDQCDLCGEPPGIAATLVAEGLPVGGSVRGFASYTRVTTLTYRAPDRFERYTSRSVGLGQRNSDFDEVKLGLDLGPMLAAPVRVYAAYRRQGAGDYREPYPALAQRNTWPTIFEGVVVRTFRLAATGSARLGSSLEVNLDAGMNRSSNDLRVPGATRTRFEGRLRVAVEPPRARVRTGLF
jgi:hypothetical protein